MSTRTRVIIGVIFLGLIGGLIALFSALNPWLDTKVSPQFDSVNQTKTETTIIGRLGLALNRLSLLPPLSNDRSLVGVIIENHELSRSHHRGLNKALMVLEFFVEGYTSRFAAVFDANRLPGDIGPVRSLRPYFIDAMEPLTFTYLHAGGSPRALEQVEGSSKYTTYNGLYYDDTHYRREEGIPAPHDFFIKRSAAKDLLSQTDSLVPISWPPYVVGDSQSGALVNEIKINYFSSLHNVNYEYQRFTGRYVRTNGGDVSDLEPRNVLILAMATQVAGEFGRLGITTTGTGPALLFRDGKVIEGTWRRPILDEWYTFKTKSGYDMQLAKGATWITQVDNLSRVSWEAE